MKTAKATKTGMRSVRHWLLALGCWSCGSAAGDVPDGAAAYHEAGPSDARAAHHEAGSSDAMPWESGSTDAGGEDSTTPAVITVPLTGCNEGAYLAEVEIGSQSFELMVDTGSGTLAVASTTCATCGVSPLYTPGPQAVDDDASVMDIYGDGLDASGGSGGGWIGEVYTDRVSAGGGAAAAVPMKLGAMTSQTNFFFPLQCGAAILPWQGLVGLAPGTARPGTDGYFAALVASRSLPNVFATQLCGEGGYWWLGGYDPTHTTAPPQYTPVSPSVNQKGAWVVNMSQLVIEGTTMDLPVGDTLLDTGDNTFSLPPAVFSTMSTAITSSSGFQAAFLGDAGPDAGGSSFFENFDCAYTSLTKEQLDSALPPVTLVFGSSPSISVTAVATESYLAPNGGGVWCATMFSTAQDGDTQFVATLGSAVLASNIVIFDQERGRVGFAPHTPCP
jgi:hypothetical protein